MVISSLTWTFLSCASPFPQIMAQVGSSAQTIPFRAGSTRPSTGECTTCHEKNVGMSCFCGYFCLMKYRKDNFKGMCVYKVQKTGAWRQLQLERPEEARVLKGTEHGNFVYNVQLVDFQNGNYSTHKINPFAWKAFGLPWPMYIKELVLPLATVKDVEKLLILETLPEAEIPVRQFDLRKYFTGFRTRQRLYYLLFNIVNTCLTLNVAFPRTLCILPQGVNFPKSSNQNCGYTTLRTSTPQMKQRKERSLSRTSKQAQESRNNNALAADKEKRAKRRIYMDRKTEEEDNSRMYLQWLADEKQRYIHTRKFIDSQTKLWDPNWERLVAIPELGCSGTLTHESPPRRQ